MRRRGATQATCVVEVGVSLPRRISGKVILVISGPGRMMYQSLEPEPEGAICCKRSMPQDDYSSPHDAGASMGHWLESNIQGRASPRPDRGVRPSGRSHSPAPALPSPHREGRPRPGPAAPARQRRHRHPVPGGHAPSPSRRSSARSPFSGSAESCPQSRRSRCRSRRRPHGTRPTILTITSNLGTSVPVTQAGAINRPGGEPAPSLSARHRWGRESCWGWEHGLVDNRASGRASQLIVWLGQAGSPAAS